MDGGRAPGNSCAFRYSDRCVPQPVQTFMRLSIFTASFAALSVVASLTAASASASAASAAPAAPASPIQQTAHLRSQLVAAETAAMPGRTLRLGLLFEHDPHWHTYWRNPGDSGLKTEVELSLPEGVQFHGIDWPAPERFVLSPEITNFGYGGRTLLPMRVTVPENYKGEQLPIQLKARWLICEHECIPGKADYQISVPVQRSGAVQADARWAADFARSDARQPRSSAIAATLQTDNEGIVLTLTGAAVPPDLGKWMLFPVAEELIDYGTLPRWQARASGWQTHLPRSDYFSALPAQSEWLLVKADQALRFTAHAQPLAN